MSVLNNLAILFKRANRIQEAVNAYREAIDIGEELVLKAPTIHQHELVKTLCNYEVLLSGIGNADVSRKTQTRLKELGLEFLPQKEEWSEEEEEEANTPGAI
ncbi:MAG: tetratricopeptide repeat protein [Candidatus Sifarchaeia archaeon]